MCMNNLDTFETSRLVIRALDIRDKEALFRYRSLPEVYRFQSWQPKDIADIEEFITANAAVQLNTRNTWKQMAVCLKTGQLIGDVGIHFLDDEQQAEIGYTLSPEFQGMGYAAEAVRAVVGHLFTQWKKHRVTASVDPDNTKSIALLERLGFRKEAHFIKSFRMNDQWFDDCVYAMLAEEWMRSNGIH